VTLASRRLVPNGLSLARLALGLAFPWLPAGWRVAMIAIAALTDFFDGLTARWLRCESWTGQVLDPVADKVFVLSLAGTLIVEGTLAPGWALAIAARDLMVVLGAAIFFARRRWADFRAMRPTWLGKCTTAAQFAVLLVLAAGWEGWRWLLWLTAGLSVATAAQYAHLYVRGQPTHRQPSPA
jgi:phosphatidylglycerophosphate synthase